MRRRTVLVRLHQEPELRLYFLVRKSQRAEHVLLKLAVGYSHGAGAKLDSVHYKVVALCTDVCGVGVQVVKALVERHCEGVMHRIPAARLLVVFKERELHYPQKIVLVLRDYVHLLCGDEPERTQRGKRHLVLVRNYKRHIPAVHVQPIDYRVKLSVPQKLCK